jgi:nicotinate-nucleotide pyrophosphorylase (carboxylating)
MKPQRTIVRDNVKNSLLEDIGKGDVTAQLIDKNQRIEMQLVSRETAILCGQDWFDEAFRQLDPAVHIEWLKRDGETLDCNSVVCRVAGNARALLSAERTALNFLQTLSATATAAHHYQQELEGTTCRILDTRKTIPGLRLAQKYAVHCGGGSNHRIGLYDAYLLKENHLAAAGSIALAVERARRLNPELLLEVEVENLDQLRQAIEAGADRVLLDNFALDQLHRAVEVSDGRTELEASGNITLDSLRQVAQTGVNYISTGAITKHVKAVDFSLRFRET